MNPLQKVAAPMLVGALLVLIGALTTSWLKASQSFGEDEGGFSIGLGLRSMEMCSDGKEHGSKCESASYSEKGGAKGGRETAMVWLGNLAFFVGLAAAIAAAVCGFMVMQRNSKMLKAIIPLAASAAGFAVGFLIAVPSMGGGSSWSPGFSMFAFLAGAAAMIVGATMATKALGTYVPPGIAQQGYPGQPGYPPQGYPQAGQMPPQQGYGQGASQPMHPHGQAASQPMAPQATPACPRDGAPTVWVAQYQRYFCEHCKQYV